MSSNHLLREHAPITETGWKLLDSEAKERLVGALGARRFVDFSGPHGWSYAATNLGRTTRLNEAPVDGIESRQRRVLPLVEVRADFAVSREELRDNERGAPDADLADLAEAALRIATMENKCVVHGWSEASMVGIVDASPYDAVPRVADFRDYPERVAQAVETLLKGGVSGPYGLAVGPDDYTAIMESTEHGGYPLFDHLREVLGGPIVWSPGVAGGVVMSLRGGDFLFESGQDLSVGYSHHDRDNVYLYLEESFSFYSATPEAAIALAAS